jgi:hypothetical protein
MFTPLSFLGRWIMTMFVVFATYNASGYSYYHWITGPGSESWPLKLFLGFVLFTFYGVFAMAIWRSMGPVGVASTIGAMTAAVWALVDYQMLDLNTENSVSTVVSTIFATLLAIGISWSHIRTRLSGQVDSKDVNSY